MSKRCFIFVFLICLSLTLIAQEKQIKIEDILKAPAAFKDEVVRLEGFVTQYVEGDAKTTSFYFLKDDWGGIIKVRTSKDRPEVGNKYIITGPVGIDPIFNEPYISEETRMQKVALPVASAPRNQYLIYGLIAAITAVIFLLVVVILSSGKKRGFEETKVSTGIETSLPQPESFIEGKTIKMAVPPEGTLKLLPGRFVVLSGDDNIKEIRFYKTKAQEECEITFGRASGKPFSHIQLKPMTVSALHAKVVYNVGKFTLINYSKTNPTKVNGQELKENESVELKDGARIEMGEIVFEFQAR